MARRPFHFFDAILFFFSSLDSSPSFVKIYDNMIAGSGNAATFICERLAQKSSAHKHTHTHTHKQTQIKVNHQWLQKKTYNYY